MGGVTVVEVPAVAHTYDVKRTLNGQEGEVPVAVEAGRQVRVRVTVSSFQHSPGERGGAVVLTDPIES